MALVTIIKLTNETIESLEKCVCLLYEPSAKTEKISGLPTTAFQDKISTFSESSSNERIIDSVDSVMPLPMYH